MAITAEATYPALSLFSASMFFGPIHGVIVSSLIIKNYLRWRWVPLSALSSHMSSIGCMPPRLL
ncbi:hypothetical protein BKA70DRAFT_1424224 [Coprinopsis sp. MPI-PUGE-AT-0042]|nr:hypothetical protein BKA70DRAFT_1424224 [Coprinopsis sp. MPI-PUGE-AT-0042]